MLVRCHEVLREAVKVFPEHLRPSVETNEVGNPLVWFGTSSVWCIPWDKDTDKIWDREAGKIIPANDFCISQGCAEWAGRVGSVSTVYGHEFDNAVATVRERMRKILEQKVEELLKVEERQRGLQVLANLAEHLA